MRWFSECGLFAGVKRVFGFHTLPSKDGSQARGTEHLSLTRISCVRDHQIKVLQRCGGPGSGLNPKSLIPPQSSKRKILSPEKDFHLELKWIFESSVGYLCCVYLRRGELLSHLL